LQSGCKQAGPIERSRIDISTGDLQIAGTPEVVEECTATFLDLARGRMIAILSLVQLF
jgi:hypothetical protein